MRRRHLESVSSRSLSVRGSWGTAPSVFWHGAPGGTQGPLGKGGVAERWSVAYPIGIATRHGAKPATPPGDQKLSPARQMNSLRLCKRPRRQATTNQPNKIHKSPICKNPLRVRVRAGPCRGMCTWVRARGSPTKIVPKGTRKNGAVPPGSAGQKQENKNFSKKFAQTGRNLPPRLRIILVEGFATRKRPPIPQKFAFCTEMTHQGETI